MAVKSTSFHTSTVVCVVVLLTCLTPSLVQAADDDQWYRPTPNLKTEIISRCLEYLSKYRTLGILDNPPANGAENYYCDKVWQLFSQAFAGVDACKITANDYMPFLQTMGSSDIKDKLLFWSKHQDLSLKLSDHGNRAVVLVDTLPGYLVSDLVWCGDPTKKNGILTAGLCPKCKQNGNKEEHAEVFWGIASETFAKRASGVVRHLVNGAVGSEPPNSAHHSGTFFARKELGNIDKAKVTQFRVIVANEPGKTIYERCDVGTIKQLQAEINLKIGKEPICVENPKPVLKIFCEESEHKNRPECLSWPSLPEF